MARLGFLGHLVVHHISPPIGEPEDLRLLGTQLGEPGDDGAVVELTTMTIAGDRSLEDPFAQCAVLQLGQCRLCGGVAQVDEPLALLPFSLAAGCGRIDRGLRHAFQLLHIIDQDGAGGPFL
jgi:hypothetical protein